MDLAQIKQRLNDDLPSFLSNLFPAGKKKGTEFCIGNIYGDEGESLKIKLSGSKAGVWSDYATGEAGDILDLVTAKRGGTLGDNLQYLAQLTGSYDPPFKPVKKVYAKYQRPKNLGKAQNEVLTYLRDERGLSQEVIDLYKIGQLHKQQIPRPIDPQQRTSDCIAFPFFDASGTVQMVKYMALERDASGKKIIWTGSNCRPTLFGWTAITDKVRTVVICEGEINAMSWRHYGIDALATPRGAGKGNKHEWVGTEWDDLARFEEIYLDFDPDDAGQEAIADLPERLGLHRIRIVPRNGAGDMNDQLRAGATLDAIEKLLADSKTIGLESLQPASAFETGVNKIFYEPDSALAGWPLPFEGFDSFRLRPAELSIWTGYNFHGKTSVLSFATLNLLAQHDQKAMIVSPELRPERQIERLVRQMTGSAKPEKPYLDAALQWLEGKYWLYNQTGAVKVDEVFQAAEYAIKRYGVRLMVVDSLMKLGLAVEDWSGQKMLTERFHTFALQHGIHIALVAHPKKDPNDAVPPTRHSVAGVGHITDIADTVVCVWRNMPKHRYLADYYQLSPMERADRADSNKVREWMEKPDAKLIVDKERNGDGDVRAVSLWYDRESMQYRERREAVRSKPIVPFNLNGNATPAFEEDIDF